MNVPAASGALGGEATAPETAATPIGGATAAAGMNVPDASGALGGEATAPATPPRNAGSHGRTHFEAASLHTKPAALTHPCASRLPPMSGICTATG